MQPEPLPWTGERYVPELRGTIAYEHVHRYAMATQLASGRSVLDIACGEGYGSWLLSKAASKVLGVDIDANTIVHANRKYRKESLHFFVGTCVALPLRSRSIDVVASFETIEHVREHDATMSEIKRVLQPDGILIISSPNKDEFSALSNEPNPFHVRELTRDEFIALLAPHFRHVTLFGQRVVYGSSILMEDGASPLVSYAWDGSEVMPHRGVFRPQFLVAIASDASLPAVSSGVFEPVAANSARAPFWPANMTEGGRLEQAERELAAVLRSTSWRITSPLRSVSRVLGCTRSVMRRVVKRR